MDGRQNPPNWRLWHPNQGLVFQQPLYPSLDAARFFTDASVVQDIGTGMTGAEEELARDVSTYIRASKVRRTKTSVRKSSKERSVEGTTTAETARLTLDYTTTEGNGTQIEEGSIDIDSKTQEEAGSEVVPGREAEATPDEEAPSGPPFTPLDYKIPEEAFNAAVAAAEGTPESFWSYTLYRGPKGEEGETSTEETKVKVHYCRSALTAERVCQYFLDEKVIGFDLEWAPDAYRYSSPRRNVSLVQIASQSRIALLHLAMYPAKDELATPTLRKIMENPEITKVGVWIKGDCNRVEKYLGIKSRGIFELSHLFRQVRYSANGRLDLINKKLVSLADQVKGVLGLPLFKGHDVRASDWSRALSMDQIVYSASDAYAAVHLFARLNHEREKLNPTPPLPFHAELGRPIPLALGIDSSSSDEADAVEIEGEAEAEAEAAQGIRDSWSPKHLKTVEERLKALTERLKAGLEMIETEEDDGENTDSKPIAKASAPKKSAAKRLKAVDETIQVEEDDGEITDGKATTSPPTPKKSAPKGPKLGPPAKDPRVVAAETRLEEYKATRPDGKTTAGPAALRAYFLWHGNEDLDPASIAALLRDPPLQTGTVSGYILDSVKREKLPFDRVRLQREVLNEFPQNLARKAFSPVVSLMEKVAVSPEVPTEIRLEDEEQPEEKES
ncbi:hypothetical protein VPNG_05644 [Cytospora leucostoma]|uniref:3'-5' exonuclease domain-containing protein n=1 Tax=Cytospora leucostoma TaxID=1230097 RepID=A0A423X6X1_9PEZI|nr:hypothetical protein VPNG_05644 [Cytospora leucostoma]